MATKNPNDKMLINRSGVSYQTPIDLENTVDSDLILVNRDGASYKLTAGEWKSLYGKISPGTGDFSIPTPVISAEFLNADQILTLTFDESAITGANEPVFILASLVDTEGNVYTQRSVTEVETYFTIPGAAVGKTVYVSVLVIDSTAPSPGQALELSNQLGPVGDFLFFNVDLVYSPSNDTNGNGPQRIDAQQLALSASIGDQIWIGHNVGAGGNYGAGSNTNNTENGQAASGVWFIKSQPATIRVLGVDVGGGVTSFEPVDIGVGFPFSAQSTQNAVSFTGSGNGCTLNLNRNPDPDAEPGTFVVSGVTLVGTGYAVGDIIGWSRPKPSYSSGQLPLTNANNLFDEEVDVLIWGCGGRGGRNGNLGAGSNCNYCNSTAQGGKAGLNANGQKGQNACDAIGGSGGTKSSAPTCAWTRGGNGGSRSGGGGAGWGAGNGGEGEKGCRAGCGGGGGAGVGNPNFAVVNESNTKTNETKLKWTADSNYFYSVTNSSNSKYFTGLIIGTDINLPGA